MVRVDVTHKRHYYYYLYPQYKYPELKRKEIKRKDLEDQEVQIIVSCKPL